MSATINNNRIILTNPITNEEIPLEKGIGTIVAERAVDLICISILIVLGLFINYELIIQKLYEASSSISLEFLMFSLAILGGIIFLLLRKNNKDILRTINDEYHSSFDIEFCFL